MIHKIFLPSQPRAQQLLSRYVYDATGQNERTRIVLAQHLCQQWQRNRIPFPPPALPKQHDVWYLLQLLSLQRHIHPDGHPYIWQVDRPEDIYIDEALMSTSKTKQLSFLHVLFNIQIGALPKKQIFSRKKLDQIIQNRGTDVVTSLHLDASHWRLALMPYNIYLRLFAKTNCRFNYNIHFDGYRVRPDGIQTGLFGGGSLYGGPSFIDSVWLDTPTYIQPTLVIIRKNYGY